jgi:hypothetical protein
LKQGSELRFRHLQERSRFVGRQPPMLGEALDANRKVRFRKVEIRLCDAQVGEHVAGTGPIR